MSARPPLFTYREFVNTRVNCRYCFLRSKAWNIKLFLISDPCKKTKMAQVLESVGRLDVEDSPTPEVVSSCRTLSVVNTSYSTRYCQTIYAPQMCMKESKRRSHTMVCLLCTTALVPDNNTYVWSSDKTFRYCIVERKLMAYVQAWCIDQLKKISLHEQDIWFPIAHKDYQSHWNLRPSHLVKLPTSCLIVNCSCNMIIIYIIICILTKQSMWSPVLLTYTVLLCSLRSLAMYASRATGSLLWPYCIAGVIKFFPYRSLVIRGV